MSSSRVLLRSLLTETKDGEWGKEAPFDDSVEMAVIRGTDFNTAKAGLLTGVPIRHIAGKAATRKKLQPFDILIETAGGSKGKPTGKTTFLRPALFEKAHLPITCASFARFMRVDPTLAEPEFIYWHLQHLYFSGVIENHQVQHTGIARFQFTKFADSTEIDLPPLRVQKGIAAFLGTFDDRIALLRETNATLEAIAQALFKSWFVDFDPVHANRALSAAEGLDEATPARSTPVGAPCVPPDPSAAAALFPDSFEESELGLVPRGWRVCTMDDVSTVGIGKTPPRKEAHWFSESSNDVRWVSIRDMGASGSFISQTSEYLTAESIERFNVRQVPNNTVLLSFKMTIGRVALTDGEMTTNEAIAHFKLDGQSPLTSEFIYLHLKQFDYTRLSSTSSIADAVNSKTVKAIPVLVPDAAVVLAFQDAVHPIFERIKLIQKQAQTLATLRDTLLPRLISGQLRLPEAEAITKESI